jgi:hypothetical protein
MGYRPYGHRGFFPPFAFFFGLFMLFMLFKTGLWIPLLVLGLIFWAVRHHRYGWEGGCGGWEKRKRGSGWDFDDMPEKPKHDAYI